MAAGTRSLRGPRPHRGVRGPRTARRPPEDTGRWASPQSASRIRQSGGGAGDAACLDSREAPDVLFVRPGL